MVTSSHHVVSGEAKKFKAVANHLLTCSSCHRTAADNVRAISQQLQEVGKFLHFCRQHARNCLTVPSNESFSKPQELTLEVPSNEDKGPCTSEPVKSWNQPENRDSKKDVEKPVKVAARKAVQTAVNKAIAKVVDLTIPETVLAIEDVDESYETVTISDDFTIEHLHTHLPENAFCESTTCTDESSTFEVDKSTICEFPSAYPSRMLVREDIPFEDFVPQKSLTPKARSEKEISAEVREIRSQIGRYNMNQVDSVKMLQVISRELFVLGDELPEVKPVISGIGEFLSHFESCSECRQEIVPLLPEILKLVQELIKYIGKKQGSSYEWPDDSELLKLEEFQEAQETAEEIFVEALQEVTSAKISENKSPHCETTLSEKLSEEKTDTYAKTVSTFLEAISEPIAENLFSSVRRHTDTYAPAWLEAQVLIVVPVALIQPQPVAALLEGATAPRELSLVEKVDLRSIETTKVTEIEKSELSSFLPLERTRSDSADLEEAEQFCQEETSEEPLCLTEVDVPVELGVQEEVSIKEAEKSAEIVETDKGEVVIETCAIREVSEVLEFDLLEEVISQQGVGLCQEIVELNREDLIFVEAPKITEEQNLKFRGSALIESVAISEEIAIFEELVNLKGVAITSEPVTPEEVVLPEEISIAKEIAIFGEVAAAEEALSPDSISVVEKFLIGPTIICPEELKPPEELSVAVVQPEAEVHVLTQPVELKESEEFFEPAEEVAGLLDAAHEAFEEIFDTIAQGEEDVFDEMAQQKMAELAEDLKDLKDVMLQVHKHQIELSRVLLDRGILSPSMVQLTDPKLLQDEKEIIEEAKNSLNESEELVAEDTIAELQATIDDLKGLCKMKNRMVTALLTGLRSNVPRERWEELIEFMLDESPIADLDPRKVVEFLRRSSLMLTAQDEVLSGRCSQLPKTEDGASSAEAAVPGEEPLSSTPQAAPMKESSPSSPRKEHIIAACFTEMRSLPEENKSTEDSPQIFISAEERQTDDIVGNEEIKGKEVPIETKVESEMEDDRNVDIEKRLNSLDSQIHLLTAENDKIGDKIDGLEDLVQSMVEEKNELKTVLTELETLSKSVEYLPKCTTHRQPGPLPTVNLTIQLKDKDFSVHRQSSSLPSPPPESIPEESESELELDDVQTIPEVAVEESDSSFERDLRLTEALQRLTRRVKVIEKNVRTLRARNDRLENLVNKLTEDAIANNERFDDIENKLRGTVHITGGISNGDTSDDDVL